MASRTDQHSAQNGSDFHHTAFEMEPELNTLRGVLVAYRTFAAQTDPVEPAAIAVLARCGEGLGTAVGTLALAAARAEGQIIRQCRKIEGSVEPCKFRLDFNCQL